MGWYASNDSSLEWGPLEGFLMPEGDMRVGGWSDDVAIELTWKDGQILGSTGHIPAFKGAEWMQ